MSRRGYRAFSLVFLFGLAGFLIYLGFDGWVINRSLPAQYIGYLIAVCGVLGMCGVNIWSGGPLDPRKDPPVRDE
jgi:hypothetical protein